MRKHGDIPTLREYLDQRGVLANGTEAEIQSARKAYRKLYKTHHKRLQRKESREVGVLLSRKRGELDRITTAAKKHRQSLPAFLKSATFAYLNKSFLSPDREFVSRLAQLLSDCLNEVQQIMQAKGGLPWHVEEKCEAIERRIVQLEADMKQLFLDPAPIEKAVKDAVAKDPALRFKLLELLVHDRQD